MRFHIAHEGDYLRAELHDRQTVAETLQFLDALVAQGREHGVTRVLICVHASRPIFKVEQYRASSYLKELARRPDVRVALVSGQRDVRAAHEYLEVLAGQQDANVRSFPLEAMAIEWLRSARRARAGTGKASAKSP
jgi:hypothetical protein